jgi:urease accessory protein
MKFGVVSAGPVADAGMIVVLGLLLAAAMQVPVAALCAIALVLAIVRGAANAGGVGPETNRLLFTAGLAVAGYATITLTMALALAFRGTDAGTPAWRYIAIRAFGSWVAAVGLIWVIRVRILNE